MTGRGLSRFHREQRGAVLVIVAICLVVLLGMLVLTADLGRMVSSRRDFVRASDAAAIAAAQQCANANGDVAAVGAADATATANETAAAQSAWSPEWGHGGADAALCDETIFDPGELASGLPSIRVGYQRDLDMFFAPIFGVETATVAAEATAVWGPAVPDRVAPFTIDLAVLTNCGIPSESATGLGCTFKYPPDNVGNPRWGALDLTKWGDGSVDPQTCGVSAADLAAILAGGGSPVPLQPPPPTWDCLDKSGLSYSINVWRALIGQTWAFPVVDIEASVGHKGPAGSEACDGTDPECEIEIAWVVSFTCLHVTDVYRPPPAPGNDIAIDTQWNGPCASGGVPDPDLLDLGVHGFRLVD